MANQQDKALDQYVDMVEFMASSLLDDDIKIDVKGKSQRNRLRIELLVPESHRGRVIGRGGRIARAMRALLEHADAPDQQSVILDIVD